MYHGEQLVMSHYPIEVTKERKNRNTLQAL